MKSVKILEICVTHNVHNKDLRPKFRNVKKNPGHVYNANSSSYFQPNNLSNRYMGRRTFRGWDASTTERLSIGLGNAALRSAMNYKIGKRIALSENALLIQKFLIFSIVILL